MDAISIEELERRFDEGEDITGYLDLSRLTHPNRDRERNSAVRRKPDAILTVDDDGTLTIPGVLLEKAGWKLGCRYVIYEDGETVTLRPPEDEELRELLEAGNHIGPEDEEGKRQVHDNLGEGRGKQE